MNSSNIFLTDSLKSILAFKEIKKYPQLKEQAEKSLLDQKQSTTLDTLECKDYFNFK
jgi:hypothetical protein